MINTSPYACVCWGRHRSSPHIHLSSLILRQARKEPSMMGEQQHVGTSARTETGDQRGWMGTDQNFFRNSNCRPISQNHHKPSRVLGEVWNSYRRAKPTQNTPRMCERKHGSERENLQTWQTWTGQTALSDRSDRSDLSLKNQTGQTGYRDRSDRLCPDILQLKLQMANLE